MNGSPIPSATNTSTNHDGTNVMSVDGKRILCTADVRGNISQLNKLARETKADYIIHTGDFGFYDRSSLDRISDRTLKHLVQYSTLIPPTVRNRLINSPIEQVRRTLEQTPQPFLSEFPEFLNGTQQLDVPVYAVWGACEDVVVLERFRNREIEIPNLFILDEANTYLLDIGGVSLRLFGLGGAVVQHKLFDNGEGSDTIAGGAGTMWTTALQIGELVETAHKVYDPSEVRILVSHASPGREGLLAQLALVLRADFTISAGLHFRYGISYNEYSCQSDQDHYRARLLQSQRSFMQLWDTIKDQVESYVDDHQAALLQNALTVVSRLPPPLRNPNQPDIPVPFAPADRDEQAFKNMWNFNLPDAAYGWLVLDISQGRVSAETRSQGFNFSYRRTQAPQSGQTTASPALSVAGGMNSTQFKTADWQQQQTTATTNVHDNDSVKEEKPINTNRNSKRMSMQRSPYELYVGGLTVQPVTEEDIREFFGNDVVTGVRFPVDQVTQMPKTHCYVDFIDPIALENAMMKNGQMLKDNKLVINRPNAGDPRNRASRNGRGRSYRGGANNMNSSRGSREPSTAGDTPQ